jgi:dTMP kinase
MFFTFEGGEGAGKSSLIASLQVTLVATGFRVLVTREPGGTEVGRKIRKLLLDPYEEKINKRTELLLFLADRAEHVEQVIRPFLKNGGIVLCDRYSDSTFAYQDDAVDFEKLFDLCSFATGALLPHRTFLLDLDPAIGLKRVAHSRGESLDRMEKKTLEFHENVRKRFLEIQKQFPQRIHKINAETSPEVVFQTVYAQMTQDLKGHQFAPL